MEHFLNTNFPEGVGGCAFSWEDFEEVVKYAHKATSTHRVGAHGRIGFRQLFAGSVATEVVKKAHCSVSVIRPRY
ncbi:MAG: universal stress protein [Bilophila wadsworthia]